MLRLRHLFALGAVGGLTISGAAVGGAVWFAAPSMAATGGGECQLNGTATFSPNGPGTTSSFSYTLNGNLGSCQSNISGAPTSGAVAVGQVLTESVTITTPTGTVTGTAKYQEPVATGSGNIPVNSCPAGSTSGTSVSTWPDGTRTVATYTTQSVGAGVHLQGTVVSAVNLTLVAGSENPSGTAPATYSLPTNNASFPVGDNAEGALTFTTSSPTQCTTSAGLTSAAVQGVIGLGSAT
jgi:hypothetical protein